VADWIIDGLQVVERTAVGLHDVLSVLVAPG